MVSLHQSRALPWDILVKYHGQRRKPTRRQTRRAILNESEPESTSSAKLLERLDFFAGQLEKVIREFAETESA